jgi:predicted small integral membrane protein
VLALLFVVGSALDALLTLWHLADGASEANPVMRLALTHSDALFLALKLSITGVSAWVLAAHQHFPRAQSGLYSLVLSYGVVLAYQLFLFW